MLICKILLDEEEDKWQTSLSYPLAVVSERIVTVRGSGDRHNLVFVKRNVVSRKRFYGGIMSNDFLSDFGSGGWEVS